MPVDFAGLLPRKIISFSVIPFEEAVKIYLENYFDSHKFLILSHILKIG